MRQGNSKKFNAEGKVIHIPNKTKGILTKSSCAAETLRSGTVRETSTSARTTSTSVPEVWIKRTNSAHLKGHYPEK